MARAKRRRTETATAGTTAKVLLGVRVSEEFHGRVLLECARRDISLQKLVTSALEHFFDSKVATHSRDTKKMKDWLAAREELKQVWEDYLDKMPLQRINHMSMGMIFDLVEGVNARPSRKEVKLMNAYSGLIKVLQNPAAVDGLLNPLFRPTRAIGEDVRKKQILTEGVSKESSAKEER